jgi:hypothetical protein
MGQQATMEGYVERAMGRQPSERVMGSPPGSFKLQQSLQQHIPPSPPPHQYGKKHLKNLPFSPISPPLAFVHRFMQCHPYFSVFSASVRSLPMGRQFNLAFDLRLKTRLTTTTSLPRQPVGATIANPLQTAVRPVTGGTQSGRSVPVPAWSAHELLGSARRPPAR